MLKQHYLHTRGPTSIICTGERVVSVTACACCAAGQRVPVTPKGQSMSPGLHGMALSPGTLLPQLPLHGMHMSQASLISPSHVRLFATLTCPLTAQSDSSRISDGQIVPISPQHLPTTCTWCLDESHATLLCCWLVQAYNKSY